MVQHPPARARTPCIVGTVALAVVVTLSCESPFEPRGEGERVPIGPVVEDHVSGDSVKWYSFVGGPNQLFVVFLGALQGQVLLAVYDSTRQILAATVTAVAGGQALDENPSSTFGSPTAGVYRLRVNALSADGTARFQFKVYAINPAPELVPASFAFGDTVTGETIEPMVDIDQFFAHGDAGQEIVAVAETPGPAGSGSVALDVVDPVANTMLGYVFADAGTSNPLTTGRMRLAGTHDYRFTLGSVTSNVYPRYRGPYRFWTYVINRAPEHRAALIPFNTEIGNERIDRAGDVDEFTFKAAAGDAYNAFVQGVGRTFQLEVAPLGGPTLAIATSQASDTALFAHATNRFQIASAGTYVVRLTGTNPYQVADTGAYRVYLYAIDRRPEHLPSAIAPGDTVAGEDIGLPGDVDEFTFDGAAGDEFNAFLQAQNGSPEAHLLLEVLSGAGTVLRTAESVGTDKSLLHQPTGRFALPGAGTYRLRVSGVESYGVEQYRGPYRLFLYRVNRRPETLPDTLTFGDSLSGEAIDVPGDVDEFRVGVRDSSGANLAFALDSQPDGGFLTVQLVDSATGKIIATASTSQGAVLTATGRMRVAPGRYIVRVSTSDYYLDRPILRGPYRLWFYRFGFGPEAVPDTFAVGDTVSGEAIEPWGDDDQFHFYGLRGQHVNIMAQGLGVPSSSAFQFFVTPPPGSPGYGLFINSPTAANALEDHQTTRVDLPGTGWYTVDVSGVSGQFAERGPYRFAVVPIAPGPEHASAALAVGDSVMTEPIDAPGDWDEFTVTATPGQDVSVIFDGRDGFTGPFADMWVFDPATLDTLASQVGQFRRIAGPFHVPSSGQFKIAVFQPGGFFRICYDATCGGIYTFVGAYGFHVVAVNRAPENVAAAYTVGDTVRGETISPVGDIDEFTSTGTPGEQLTPFLRLTTQASLDSAAVLEVIDPTTGASLVGSNIAIYGATFASLGSFTVPPSGSFLIRVHVYGSYGYGVGETSYEFFVKRGS